MTLSVFDLAFYAGALFILFLTPGPVWVALTARALSGGFAGAWPLAVGVALGDAIWPLAAIFGLAWLVATVEGLLEALRWVAAGIFLFMGYRLIRRANRTLSADSRLLRPGRWAGFLAGVAVIVGNPKAILFYMGVLPGFFDLTRISGGDIAAIVACSVVVPLLGNLCFAWFIDRIRRLLSSPDALARTNITAGILLIAVGLVIPFT
jgi:threonine/homoserine/homoserine lactone efflux protein